MNWKFLLILVVAAAAAVVAVYQLRQQPDPAVQASTSALLYPDLEQRINDIERIKLAQAGDQVVADLQRDDASWVVANKGGYPADLSKIRKLILDLAGAKVIEQKTANPEFYRRLGVEDTVEPNAQGMHIEIAGLDAPLSLIVGNNASGTAGTYVRRADQSQSLLIDASVNLDREASGWLQQPITDIPGERLQRASVRHPDGEVVTVYKEKRSDSNFKLFNILDGRELSYDTVANPTGHVLTSLQLEDVVARDALDLAGKELIETDFYTFDGLKITVRSFQQDDETAYAMFDVSYDQEQARQFASADQQSSDSQENADKSDDAIRSEAEQLHQRLQPWAFAISEFKYRNLSKRLEDFLKPLESTPQTDSAPQPPPDASLEINPSESTDTQSDATLNQNEGGATSTEQ